MVKNSAKRLRIGKFCLYLHSQSEMACAARKQNDGAIAQLVEQRTENPCVPGSIPGGTTSKKSR